MNIVIGLKLGSFFFYNITLNNSWLLFNVYLLKKNYGLTALENY